MGESIYRVTNQESRRSVEVVMAKTVAIEALRADLAQLDEWLTACEELRLLDQSQITREMAKEIGRSPVAPGYLQKEARRRDRAILQVTDAIFVAQGDLMAKLNNLEGTVLWHKVTESKAGTRKIHDGPEPADYRITKRPRPCPRLRAVEPTFFDESSLGIVEPTPTDQAAIGQLVGACA